MTDLEKVEQFHKTFGLPVLDEPEIPEDRKQLRANLIMEEAAELEEAILEGDLTGVLKEASDLLYVLHGMVLEFGLGELFEQAFDKVHKSNMTKTITKNQVVENLEYYADVKNTMCKAEEVEDEIFVLRRMSDGKVLKPLSYKPAQEDIIKLLKEELKEE